MCLKSTLKKMIPRFLDAWLSISLMILFPLDFYGVKSNGICGIRVILKIKENQNIVLHMGVGVGTNTNTKMLALWGFLWFAKHMGLLHLQVPGYTKVVINWANGKDNIVTIQLVKWKHRVLSLMKWLSSLYFSHIIGI